MGLPSRPLVPAWGWNGGGGGGYGLLGGGGLMVLGEALSFASGATGGPFFGSPGACALCAPAPPAFWRREPLVPFLSL